MEKLEKLSPKKSEMVPVHPKFFSNFNPPPRFYEENDCISQTNPDVGLSLKEMVERYVLGEPIMGHDVYFDDDIDNMAPQNFDLSDLTESQADAQRELDKLEMEKESSGMDDESSKAVRSVRQDEDRSTGKEQKAVEGQRPGKRSAKERSDDKRSRQAVPTTAQPVDLDSELSE